MRVFAVTTEYEHAGPGVEGIFGSKQAAQSYISRHDEPDEDGYGWLIIEEYDTVTGMLVSSEKPLFAELKTE